MDAAVKLAIEMDAQRRREELKRLFAPRLRWVSYPGPGIDPFWRNFWWMYYDQEDIRPVFARDIRAFGWDRALERVPGVVVR